METRADEKAKPSRPARRKWKMRVFKLVLVAGVGLLVVLVSLAAERAARHYETSREIPPDYFPSIYYPHRHLRYALVPDADYYGWLQINSLGFRGREFSAEKPAGVLRVVCIGGSTTFDIGSVGEASPWPEVMEAELRELLGSEDIEVLNLGIGGANSLDSLIDLQLRALDLGPDLVVVYQGHNDAAYSIPSFRPSKLFPMEDKPRSGLVRWLTYNSLLYAKTEGRVADKIRGWFRPRSSAPTARDEAQIAAALDRGLAKFRSNMRSIAAIARDNDIPLVLPQVVMPFPDQAEDGCTVCANLIPTFANVKQIPEVFDRYDDVLKEVAEANPSVFHVPTEGFVPAADAYYHDPIHFGPQGSFHMGRRLAQAIAPILLQNGESDRSDP